MVDQSWTGRTIGSYRLGRVLGKGGMGLVFLAEDTTLKREVAIKFVHRELSDDVALRRFRKEALTLSKLNHPGIATVFAYDDEGGTPYLVLEYVPGQDLGQRLAAGPIERDEALEMASQIAAAVGEAHELGVYHRDLKPSNIHVTDRGRVKVLDFGIARWAAGGEPDESDEALTKAFELVGTPRYMAPEQMLGVFDARSDVFALGLLMYEMLTGRQAFEGKSATEVMLAIRDAAPAGLAEFERAHPRWLVELVERCLAKAPEERFANAKELAQALEAGRSGDRRTFSSRRLALLAVGLVAVTALVVSLLLRPSAEPAVQTVAVLPFEDLSSEGDRGAFASGLTVAMIDELGQLHALRVLSHTSVKRFAESDMTLAEIGQALGVDAVIEGAVSFVGEEVQIRVSLLDAETEERLWGETIQRPVGDLLAAQGHLAKSLSQSLDLELSSDELSRLERARPIDPQALDLIFRGRSLWEQRVPEAFERSIECFERAIELDPDAAEAHAELARPYCIMAVWGALAPHASMPKAKAAARHALELDPNIAWAHTVEAWSGFVYDFDLARSERSFRRALDIQPSNSTTHEWFALMLVNSGRGDEAIEHMRRALALDEFSPVMNTVMGTVLAMAGRHDEALVQLEQAARDFPDFPLAHLELGYVYVALGRHAEAAAAFGAKPAPLTDSFANGALAHGLALAGDPEGARAILVELEEARAAGGARYTSPVLLAFAHAALGDVETAAGWMEVAEEERDSWLGLMHGRPIPPALRRDARFRALVRRLGFAPE